jgi:hypothetical protein
MPNNSSSLQISLVGLENAEGLVVRVRSGGGVEVDASALPIYAAKVGNADAAQPTLTMAGSSQAIR